MNPGPPPKTYAQHRNTRTVLTQARMEDMKRAVDDMTAKRGPRCAQKFNVYAAIKAVEEVSVRFACFPPSKVEPELH